MPWSTSGPQINTQTGLESKDRMKNNKNSVSKPAGNQSDHIMSKEMDDDEGASVALSPSKLEFLRRIPRDKMIQAGFGDLNLDSLSDQEDFLS